MRSIALASDLFSPPENFEHALSGGTLVVFGESMPEILAKLDAEPEMSSYDGVVVASVRAKDLPLPRELTVRAMLIFAHPIPGVLNRKPTVHEMECSRCGEPCRRKGCRGIVGRTVQSVRSTFNCGTCKR